MNRLALAALDPRPGEHVIELGFGGGALLRRVAGLGADAVGVDVSQAMVARARRHGLRALEGRAEALPLPDGSADKAVSVNSLYFWPDLPAALAELARVLRPDGLLVLCFQSAEAVRAWPGHRFGFRAYEEAEIRAELEEAEFHAVASSGGRSPKLGEFICLSALRGSA